MPMVRHVAAIRRLLRWFQGLDDPPEAASATLKGRLKGFTYPTFFKPSWTNRWVNGRLKSVRRPPSFAKVEEAARPLQQRILPAAAAHFKCAAHHRGGDLVVSYWAVSTI